jgi:membrane-bound metal-dependent hydrolase YbcI (DUF457 family)
MSWAAHDLEPYAIQRHLGGRVAIVPLLVGSYSPDLATKWFVYGISTFGVELGADDPVRFHRGWPGAGFTHSLAFGVVVAAAILLVFRKRPAAKVVALSFLLGHWAHALTDVGDTVGTMLFFPFSTETVHADAWAYAGQTDRFTDAGAYYSGFGWVWDGVWVAYGLIAWRVLTRSYFHETIVPADPFWGWVGRLLPEAALLALYRASFFYGSARWLAWLIWAHVVHDFPFDLTWGGPHWVPAARPPE